MPKGIDALVERIGAQLGAVDEVIDLGKKYQAIVVAKVVTCDRHPNADKLSLCLIDDAKKVKNVKRNKDGLIQVVCGAPNVAVGQLVAWLPPGATVPATIDKEPLVLEAREIRGEVSNGMLASLKELDLGDDHSGILVLKAGKPGDDFAKAVGLDDYIIDIENKMFTHRPDLFGQLGIARELAGVQQMVFRSPRWYLSDKTTGRHKTDDKLLEVKNQIPKLVPRFMMQVIKNIEVGPSSVEIFPDLAKVGIRPINNIVDVTNHVMMETAQPLHAYDYDKVKALSGTRPTILVRQAKKAERLKILGGKEISLQGTEMVIATDKQAIGLAGVMGGAETEVDETTKNIILECGNFDMNATRRTAMAHGLFTDAATRFTKGQSPWQNVRALSRVVDYIVHEAGGLPARSIYDLKGKLANPVTVRTSTEFINSRLGLELSAGEIKKLLENVEFKVQVGAGKLTVEAPFWRSDIEISEDIVEEVGRLYGYDHLKIELPMRDIAATSQNRLLQLKSQIRRILSSAGANEVLTYSFAHGSLIEKVGQDSRRAFHVKNALSPDLQYYRLSLAPSLLEKIHPNVKLGFDKFVLFEMGQAYAKDKLGPDKLPLPMERLALVGTKAKSSKDDKAPYYAAKKQLENLLYKLGIESVFYDPVKDGENQTATYYEPARSANIMAGDKKIGVMGEYRPSVATSLKLPEFCSGFELHTDELLDLIAPLGYQPLNRFPSIDQDISLRLPAVTSYADAEDFLRSQLDTEAAKHGYNFAIEPVDIFQKPNDREHKQITIRIKLEHSERTLTMTETNKLLDIIAANAKAKLKAERL